MNALIQTLTQLRERLSEQHAAAEAAAVAPYSRNDPDQDDMARDMESQWHDGFHRAIALALAELDVILHTPAGHADQPHNPDTHLTRYAPGTTREPYMASGPLDNTPSWVIVRKGAQRVQVDVGSQSLFFTAAAARCLSRHLTAAADTLALQGSDA